MSLPDGFATTYTALLGEEAPAFLATFDEPALAGYRINPMRPAATLTEDGPAVPWSTWGHFGQVAGNGIDHVAGYVYSQEPSAQFVGTVTAPKAGQRVLDLCAAPGGKTTHLASYLNQTGMLVANEINAGRAKVLASNVERFGLTNTVVTNNDPDHLAAQWPATFDVILVDAPCSGEGMFRKDPEAMAYWTPDYPAQCAKRQRAILTAAVGMLKPGGRLVYSTCTFAPQEDEQIAAWARTELGLTIVPIAKSAGIADGRPEWGDGGADLAGTARLWPHLVAGEGHFVAQFVKPGETAATGALAAPAKRLPRTEAALWDDFVRNTFVPDAAWPTGELVLNRDHMTLRPAGSPDLTNVRVVRGGLELGTFKKNRFEASHSLATALPPTIFQQVVPVSPQEFAAYRHGDTLARPDMIGKRTVLLTLDDKPFALGKLVNGTVKNAYPKGLRR